MPAIDMKRIAVRGGVAVGVSQAVRIGTQVVSVVVLSRLLEPGDFGLVASVSPIVAFVTMLQGLGLQQAVIRQSDLPHEQLSRIFWLTLAVSLASAALLVALAPAVAAFYGDPRLRAVTVVMAAGIVLTNLLMLPAALLSRNLRFGQTALIDIAGSLIGIVAAVTAALSGAGYWTLPVGSLTAAMVWTALNWMVAGWLPGRLGFRLPDRALLRFGANLSGFTLVNFFARNLDNVLIGRFWGPVALGYYDRSYSLMMFPLQAISAPISSVMIPLLGRIQTDKAQLRSVYLRAIGQVVLLTLPGMAALASASDDVIALVFGPRWMALSPIFAWLGWAGLLQPAGNSSGWLYIAQGRTQAMFRWGLFASATTILSFVAGLPWGAVGVAAGYTLSEYLLRSPLLYWVLGRIGPVSFADMLWLQVPLLLSAALTKLVHDMALQEVLGLAGIPMIAATVLVSYALALAGQALFPSGRLRLLDTLELLRQGPKLMLRQAGAPT